MPKLLLRQSKWPMDDMARSGEEEDLLERAVGDGDIQGKLDHQGCL